MIGTDIEHLMKLLARLPGMGPRSARRAALHLLKNRESLMLPLSQALGRAAEVITECPECHNLDTCAPCAICSDSARDRSGTGLGLSIVAWIVRVHQGSIAVQMYVDRKR